MSARKYEMGNKDKSTNDNVADKALMLPSGSVCSRGVRALLL